MRSLALAIFCALLGVGSALPVLAAGNPVFNGISHDQFGDVLRDAGFDITETTTSDGDKFYFAKHPNVPDITFGMGAIGCENSGLCAATQYLFVDPNPNPSSNLLIAVNDQLVFGRVSVADDGTVGVVSRHLVAGGAAEANIILTIAAYFRECSIYLEMRYKGATGASAPGTAAPPTMSSALARFNSALKTGARAGFGTKAARSGEADLVAAWAASP